MSIYDIEIVTIDEETESMRKYAGKVLLIVNTASQCGFTPQFKELEALYKKFGNEKFEILGFPCNQFADQEPLEKGEIKNFCEINYGVTFPLFSKIDVNGANTHPLYKLLKTAKRGLLSNDIKWNFTKFLVDHQGNVVKRYASAVTPFQIEKDIVKLIEKI